MKKLFENKDKDLFEFIIYFLFIIRKSFIRTNTAYTSTSTFTIQLKFFLGIRYINPHVW